MNTTHVEVLYSYQGTRLASLLETCRPFRATPSGLAWFHGEGGNYTLEIRLDGNTIASMPHLGQIIAAAQANQGVIPCG